MCVFISCHCIWFRSNLTYLLAITIPQMSLFHTEMGFENDNISSCHSFVDLVHKVCIHLDCSGSNTGIHQLLKALKHGQLEDIC